MSLHDTIKKLIDDVTNTQGVAASASVLLAAKDKTIADLTGKLQVSAGIIADLTTQIDDARSSVEAIKGQDDSDNAALSQLVTRLEEWFAEANEVSNAAAATADSATATATAEAKAAPGLALAVAAEPAPNEAAPTPVESNHNHSLSGTFQWPNEPITAEPAPEAAPAPTAPTEPTASR